MAPLWSLVRSTVDCGALCQYHTRTAPLKREQRFTQLIQNLERMLVHSYSTPFPAVFDSSMYTCWQSAPDSNK